MGYEGRNIDTCRRDRFPWDRTYAVVVTGSGLNACGHAILNVGGEGLSGHYFHIAGNGYARPYYMDANGYKRYLKENNKTEISRRWLPLSNPDGAQSKLEELSAKKWLWGGLINNCATFVEVVAKAGGSKRGLYSNCPVVESF